MTIQYSTYDYHKTVSSLRSFFLAKGFVETHVQDRLSILAACEDPTNLTAFQYLKEKWPLPQTGQMWLEHELLRSPSLEGVFCITTSYRQEKNPKPGRHNVIFPMFEFESKGTLDDLITMERELCEHMGFGSKSSFAEVHYEEAMKKYDAYLIGDEEEGALCKDFTNVVMLRNFPMNTSPFWNMKFDTQTGTAKKVDVIVNGMETIGSAERSCNPDEMREQFYSISDGKYAEILFDHFTRERVEKELEEFLSYDFFPRYGGGIGVTRMIQGLRSEGLLGEQESYRQAA